MKTSQKQSPMQRISLLEEGAAIVIAFGVDWLGEPPLTIHPVVWYGTLIRFLERRAPQTPVLQLLYGTLMLVLAAPIAWLPPLLIQRSATGIRTLCRLSGYSFLGGLLFAFIEGASLKPFFALRMLVKAGERVRHALEQQDLPGARDALGYLVSRDRRQLSEELIVAAAVESLAENVSDSIVAPLFYYMLFGLPGATTYRLFNTFDSMIGYHGRYEYLGKAAARLDDLLNLLPSRFTAFLILAFAPLFGGKRRTAWQIWRRDARKTESPNAGHPMAAIAGALEVQLEKVDHYILGDAHTPLTSHHIHQAEHMVWWIGGSTILLAPLLKRLWRTDAWTK